MNIVSNKKIYFPLVCSVLFLPYSVFASTVYIDSDRSDFYEGDTVMFSVRVDSENKNINATEGTILLKYPLESVSLVDINTSGSNFSLWPSKPLPSVNNTSISFAGGSPGGLTSQDAIIFNIVLKLQKTGLITLAPENIGVYLHDGKGTKDAVRVKNLVIDIVPKTSDSRSTDEWSTVISNDKKPPEPFEIYPGQDASVYDGKKFLSFSTTDEQSGVSYYEVIEGDNPPVRSNDTYILQEQDKPVKVTISAYDAAGNARKSIYSSTPYNVPYLTMLILVALIFVVVMYKKRKRSPKNTFVK